MTYGQRYNIQKRVTVTTTNHQVSFKVCADSHADPRFLSSAISIRARVVLDKVVGVWAQGEELFGITIEVVEDLTAK